jgi:hypothetical protein
MPRQVNVTPEQGSIGPLPRASSQLRCRRVGALLCAHQGRTPPHPAHLLCSDGLLLVLRQQRLGGSGLGRG